MIFSTYLIKPWHNLHTCITFHWNLVINNNPLFYIQIMILILKRIHLYYLHSMYLNSSNHIQILSIDPYVNWCPPCLSCVRFVSCCHCLCIRSFVPSHWNAGLLCFVGLKEYGLGTQSLGRWIVHCSRLELHHLIIRTWHTAWRPEQQQYVPSSLDQVSLLISVSQTTQVVMQYTV